jgi:periplasmic protein TonB
MGNLIPNMAWEDVIFEGRNKDYGAYRIRYDYPNHLTFSTLFVVALFLSVILGHWLLNEKHGKVTDTQGHIIPIINPDRPPDIEMDKVTKPAGSRYATPVVTKEDVPLNQQVPTQDQATAMVENSVVDKAALIENTNEIVVLSDAPLPVIEVAKVEAQIQDIIKKPEFPGGMAECAKWLSRHLEYPAMAVRMGIEGKVVVEFTVGEDGNISEATILEGLHKLCDQEAIRLVKSMPAWTPGEKNGIKTVQKYTLPIRFVLQ